MALRSRALVLAHCRGVWNQAAREAGQGAKIGGAIVIVVTAGFLLPISVALFLIARTTGMSLAASGDPSVLSYWTGEQALFAFFFPLFGSLRFKPSFPGSRFGRYPVSVMELLLAEIPASLVEVFPILGIGGIVVTNAGLAVAMPRMIPAIAVVTITSVIWFVATMFAISAAARLLFRLRLATAMTLLALLAIPVLARMLGIRGLLRAVRTAVNVWLPALIERLPLSRGYEGILALHAGAFGKGLSLIATYVAVTSGVAAIAAAVHARRMSAEVDSPSWGVARERPLRFDKPASGIASV